MDRRRHMEVWIRRPLIWTVFSYGFGIVLSYFVHINTSILLIGAMVFLLYIVYLHFIHRLDFAYVLVMFLMLGWLRGLTFLNRESPLYMYTDRDIYVVGEIVDFPQYYDNRDVYIVKTEKIIYENREYAVNTKIRLTVYKGKGKLRADGYTDSLYVRGDRILFEGRLENPPAQRNPKGSNYRLYLKNKGIYNIMSIDENSIKPYSQDKRNRKNILHAIANWMDKAIGRYAMGEGSRLLKSMILGQRWELPSEIRDTFSKTGTAHILAISGLHVGFIMMGIDLCLRRFYLRRSTMFFIQTAVLSTYCILIGAPPSAMRATIMAIISLGGYALNRPEDRANTLAFAGLIILLVKPGQLFDVGFQMSFGAVGGIMLLYTRFKDRLYFIPKGLADILTVTIGAQLGVGMFVAYHYNIVSPISIVANLLFIPLAGLIVQLGFLLIISSLIFPPLAKLIGYIIGYLSFIFIEGNYMLGSIPLSSKVVISPPIFIIICYYVSIWLLSDERPASVDIRKMFTIIISAVVIFILVISVYPADFKVVFLDVGQGDCIYIRTPDKRHILIDAGGVPYRGYETSFDTGAHIVLPFLLKNGVHKLDLVVASHWHDDHVGGLFSVLDNIRTDTFLYYPPYESNDVYRELMDLLERRDIARVEVERGQTYKVGSLMECSILHPYAGIATDNENNRSIVMHVKYKDTSLMFTGDIEGEVENMLVRDDNLTSHMLKVAHHGSITSSTEEWIEGVGPMFAVIQVGKNTFNHPHEDVIDRFKIKDIRVYRTDVHGAVICRYRKGGWKVKCMILDEF